MQLSKEHTYQLFGVGFLLMVAVFFSLKPIANSDQPALASSLPINTEANAGSTIYADDFDLPANEPADGKSNLSKLLLSEGADKKEAETGANKLVFIKQAQTGPFLPAEGFSVDLKFHINQFRLIRNEYRSLYSHLFVFVHNFNFPPLISGIAINAP